MTACLTTPRLFIRELSVADCSDIYLSWLHDPLVNRFLETRLAPHSMSSVTEFVETIAGREDEFLFGIFRRDDGQHIGNIKIGPIRQPHRLADVSLFIGARDCWGKGFASEAIMAVSRHAFRALGVAKLSASMYAPNIASGKAFQKAGYVQEGVRREHYELEGARCDLIEFGMVAVDDSVREECE